MSFPKQKFFTKIIKNDCVMLSSNFIFIGINNSLQFKILYKKFFHLTGQQNVI